MRLDRRQMRGAAAAISDDIRRFNLREGLTPEHDRLPARFHLEALPETGSLITSEQMETLLVDYYASRGWNARGEPPAE
jgi:aldehyde:ferredoxin oxidoreductase